MTASIEVNAIIKAIHDARELARLLSFQLRPTFDKAIIEELKRLEVDDFDYCAFNSWYIFCHKDGIAINFNDKRYETLQELCDTRRDFVSRDNLRWIKGLDSLIVT